MPADRAKNGLALYSSIGNYLRGNSFHQNPTGGVFVYASSSTVPVNNSIQRNYMGYHGSNGGVITNMAGATDVGFNFIAGNPFMTGIPIAGFLLEGTANSRFYSNVIENLSHGKHQALSLFTNTSLCLDAATATVTQSLHLPGCGCSMGLGVHDPGWEFLLGSAAGEWQPQQRFHPLHQHHGQQRVWEEHRRLRGSLPYQSESMGREYRLVVQTPPAGVTLAAGSQKTISWNSQGCVLVGINLLNASNNSTPIASNYQDFGYYRWTVPAVAPGVYSVQVTCKNSAGAAAGYKRHRAGIPHHRERFGITVAGDRFHRRSGTIDADFVEEVG